MEDRSRKPPKSARAIYVKFYCKKQKSIISKGSSGVRKALKSWRSLTPAEQQPFVEKFNLIQEKYKENSANYLNLVEPFMKKKALREEEKSDHCVCETVISNKDNHLQAETEIPQDINESISNQDSNHNKQVIAASVTDQNENDPKSPPELNSAADELLRIPEPTPPCTKNGKELFEMVNNVTGEQHLEWKNLSQVQKKKYQSAVLAIKREYIKKYMNYVESLPPQELFQHYNKTMEK